jgi:hypothetical protein
MPPDRSSHQNPFVVLIKYHPKLIAAVFIPHESYSSALVQYKLSRKSNKADA